MDYSLQFMVNSTKPVDNSPGKEDLEKEKEFIEELIVKSGMRPSDPLFKLYAHIGTTQYAIAQLPGKLDSVISGWTLLVDKKLDEAADVAIVQQKSAIAKAAEELVKSTNKYKNTAPVLNLDISNIRLAQVGLALGCVLALGAAIGGFTFSMVASSQASGAKPTVTKLEDVKLLEWAKSKEGRDARLLYNRNAGIIQTCRQGKNPGGCIVDVRFEK
ncbi:unknown protein [Rivularia sp. IAM M-261]|nr:unknown protein [Rivularia sp. IAM M-261]